MSVTLKGFIYNNTGEYFYVRIFNDDISAQVSVGNLGRGLHIGDSVEIVVIKRQLDSFSREDPMYRLIVEKIKKIPDVADALVPEPNPNNKGFLLKVDAFTCKLVQDDNGSDMWMLSSKLGAIIDLLKKIDLSFNGKATVLVRTVKSPRLLNASVFMIVRVLDLEMDVQNHFEDDNYVSESQRPSRADYEVSPNVSRRSNEYEPRDRRNESTNRPRPAHDSWDRPTDTPTNSTFSNPSPQEVSRNSTRVEQENYTHNSSNYTRDLNGVDSSMKNLRLPEINEKELLNKLTTFVFDTKKVRMILKETDKELYEALRKKYNSLT